MKITKETDEDTTTYFYDGVKKYEHYQNYFNGYEIWMEYDENNNQIHYKNSDRLETWREYKDGKEIYYKNSNGLETLKEYKDGKLIHYKDSDGDESWSEYKDGEQIYYKNSDGDETWSDDNPENPKNLIKEEDVRPFEFGN